MKKDELEYLFSNVNRWINNADGKINIFIGIQLGVIGLLFFNFFDWSKSAFSRMTLIESILFLIGILFVLWSIFHSLKGIFPILKSRGENGELVYFGAITKISLSKFRKLVSEATDKQYIDDLVEQIYTNSHIAQDKFESYKKAVISFLSGMSILIFIYLAMQP